MYFPCIRMVPDASQDGVDRLSNIENVGFSDGTFSLPSTTNEHFRPLDYVASYRDLSNYFGTTANPADIFNHFAYFGRFEGRTTTFDGLEYIASYVDLMNVFGANADAGATHYIQFGHAEGRTTTFDGLNYIASYGDLVTAFGANADAGATHYIQFGHAEGRTISFDGLEYIASYGDLINALGANASAGTHHYIGNGYAEGRHVSFDGLEYIASYSDLISAFHRVWPRARILRTLAPSTSSVTVTRSTALRITSMRPSTSPTTPTCRQRFTAICMRLHFTSLLTDTSKEEPITRELGTGRKRSVLFCDSAFRRLRQEGKRIRAFLLALVANHYVQNRKVTCRRLRTRLQD